MNRLKLVFEWISIVLLMAAAATVLYTYAKPVYQKTQERRKIEVYQVGDRLPEPNGVKYTDRTFVLFTRSQCDYCTKNMPLYRELAQKGARIIAVTPEDTAVNRAYLAAHEVNPEAVIALDGSGFRFAATPSLVQVDSRGVVKGVWWGLQRDKNIDDIKRRVM